MSRLANDTLPAVVTAPPQRIRIPGLAVSYRRPVAEPAAWKSLIWLAVVTALGTFFRFYHLTYPALWNDETLVFWRACGTYGQMLVPLSTDGFPPLHYSLYWLMGHPVPVERYVTQRVLGIGVGLGFAAVLSFVAGRILIRTCSGEGVRRRQLWLSIAVACCLGVFAIFVGLLFLGPEHFFPARWSPGERTMKLTPWIMRSVPAVSGSLTIPAMYFLARQMFSRGTSLVAALFTACSAFMLFYSRDAKMYPDLWLFVTLSVGCLLWWCRTGTLTAFLCWVASGCAMTGLHASGLAIPTISVLFFLTQRTLTLARGMCFLAGTVLVVSGPVVYATMFNKWTDNVDEYGWSKSGIGWVSGFYNGPRTGPDHALYATSAFLIGYEWPRDDYVDYQPWNIEQHGWINPALLESPELAFQIVFWVIAAGALPWPMIWRPRRSLDPPREPLWRVSLWLGTWVFVCAYGMYCHSVGGFVDPRRWVQTLLVSMDLVGIALAEAGIIVFVIATLAVRKHWPAFGRFVQITGVVAVVYGLLMVVYHFAEGAAGKAADELQPWQSIWLPRYIGYIWPGVGLLVAALLMRLPTRPVRTAAVAFVLLVNLGMAYLRLALCTEPPIDRLAHDVYACQKPDATIRTFDLIEHGDLAVAGSALDPHGASAPETPIASGRYYMQMEADHQPMSPELFRQSYYWYRLHDNQDYTWFQREVAAATNLNTVVIWSMQRSLDPVGIDPYFQFLPQRFKFVSEDVYPVRVSWDFRQRWTWIRREYAAKS